MTSISGLQNLVSFLQSRDYTKPKIVARSFQIWSLVANFSRHRRVYGAISHPDLSTILAIQPQAPMKYLNPNYLAQSLTISQRADAFTHHYRYLSKCFGNFLIKRIVSGGFELWAYSSGCSRHVIDLKFSHPVDNEGELTIEYICNGTPIYWLSFTIVAGNIFGMSAGSVIFLTRIQGIRNNFDAVREATKSLRDISPPYAMMAALQGFDMALGIDTIVAVSSETQVSFVHQRPGEVRMYGQLLHSLGGVTLQTGANGPLSPGSDATYIELSHPFPEKPITDVKRTHRSRTKARRSFRHQISNLVSARVAEHLQSPPEQLRRLAVD